MAMTIKITSNLIGKLFTRLFGTSFARLFARLFVKLVLLLMFIFYYQSGFSLNYTVSASGDSHEIISPKNRKVTKGKKAVFTVKPKSDYKLGKTVSGACAQGVWSGHNYTTGAVTKNCKVVFAAAKVGSDSVAITTSGDGHESISPAQQSVLAGTYARFAVKASSGYTLSKTVGGSCPKGTWNSSAYIIKSNNDCSATFSSTQNSGGGGTTSCSDQGKFKLTVKNYISWCNVSVNGGTASGIASQSVCVDNGDIPLFATPKSGFILGKWHHTSGDAGSGDVGTVSGNRSSTTATVNGQDLCVWVCCPFTNGSGCNVADQC